MIGYDRFRDESWREFADHQFDHDPTPGQAARKRPGRAVSVLVGLAALVASVGLLAGCHSSGSAGADKARASALATSAAVKADEAHAQAILKPCIATGHVATAKSCIEKAVPPAQRQALVTCLSEAALKGWHSLETTGAQACLVKVGV